MKNYRLEIIKTNIFMISELLKIVKLLQKNNIHTISFKGPSLAQVAYHDITARQFVDLDLLLDKKDIKKAISILIENDYIPEDNLEYIMKKESIFHDITLQKNGVDFELHWRLFSNEFQVDFQKINMQNYLQQVTINGSNIFSLDNELLLIYLSIHGVKHNWERLAWLLDIAKIIQNNDINWNKTLEIMHKTKTKSIFLTTLYLCKELFFINLPEDIQSQFNDKKIKQLAIQQKNYFYQHFNALISEKTHSKKISKIQFDLLSSYKHKYLFLSSLLKPTEVDFQAIKLPQYLHFFYYFVRPYNLLMKKIKRK